jgi:16S rRNA (uracil1498-N3)-methyltransferase
MSSHRFYLPPDQCRQNTLLLTAGEAHHASRVLRLRPGDRVTVLDGAGHEFVADIAESNRDEVRLAVIETRSTPPPAWQLTLLQAVPKGKLLETIIQKATELGAARVVPVLSERAVPHLDSEAGSHKTGKWQQVAIEAIKQCGSAWLPQVEAPLTPRQFLARQEQFELPLIASLQPGSRHPREYFRSFRTEHGRPPRSVCIWIGPEGDFSPEEVALVQSAGALPISLGPLVLRTETAALYCLSVLSYELQSP